MAIHSGILNEEEVSDLFNGNSVMENLLGMWNFDDFEDPLACVSTISSGASHMYLSSEWEGDVVVVSDAPFTNLDFGIGTFSHLVLSETDTAIQLPPLSLVGNSVEIISISQGVSVFQFDNSSGGCRGSQIFPNDFVNDSQGFTCLFVFLMILCFLFSFFFFFFFVPLFFDIFLLSFNIL